MWAILKEMIRDEGAQTTTEYGLLLGFLALSIIIPLAGMRDGLPGRNQIQGMLRMAMNAQFRRKSLFRSEPNMVQGLSRAEPVFKRV